MDAEHYVHVDMPLCQTGELNPYNIQHKHMDGPQHIRADVHSDVSVRKK